MLSRYSFDHEGAILPPQLENRFTLPIKQQSMIQEMQESVNMSVLGWPESPRRAALRGLSRGRRMPRLGGSLHCQAPLPPGCPHSLIMINILLEAFHYHLPPSHLWFWTPDTSPSIPPGYQRG